MLRLFKKKVLIILIFTVLFILILYLKSLIPKKIDITYDGIMYSTIAYQEKDYDNLDVKNTKVHIKGKLHKAWFKEPYFYGYIDTDLAPINDTILRSASSILPMEYVPVNLSYDYYDNSKIEEYSTVFLYKNMRGVYLEMKEFSGYEGYSVVAPGSDLKDINAIWKDVYEKIYVIPNRNLRLQREADAVQTKDIVGQSETIVESDTFLYDGTNAASYHGELNFVITDKANEWLTDDMSSFQISSDLEEIKAKLKSVKTVIVNDKATKLYSCMLKYFQNATKLHIGKYVNTIHMESADDFFGEDYMKALSTIEVDKENSYFIVKDNVLYSADMKTLYIYLVGKKDTSFSIPDTVMNFSGTYLGRNDYLLKLHFGKSFGSLDVQYDSVPSITSGLSSLQEITVDADNAYLLAVDGVLYNKEQTKTIAWPEKLVLKNVTFPSTVKSTALSMISSPEQVKTITLSRDMEELWVYDFTSRLDSFTNLKKISVPSDNNYFTVWKGGLYNKDKTIFYGFPQKSSLSVLEFPKGVTQIEIGNNVYPNIEKVILPSTFKKFYTHEGGGFTQFSEMFPRLKSVRISSKCKNYKSIDGIVFNKNATKLIVYPKCMEKISYIIPDSVSYIKGSLFSGFSNLKTLTIGENLQPNLSWDMLMGCSNISAFETVKNCKNYKAIDGILYNKKITRLEAYPPYKKASTYKVPDSVKDISNLRFPKELKNLVLGKNVKNVGDFTNMEKLENISVNKNNLYYSSKNGILYNKMGTEVIYNPKN